MSDGEAPLVSHSSVSTIIIILEADINIFDAQFV